MFPNDSLVRLDTVHLIEIIIQCRTTRGRCCAPETKVVVRGKNTHDLTKAVINRDCAPSNLRFESAVERTSRQIEIHRFSESRSSRSKTSLVPPFAFYNYSRDSLFIARETHSNPCTFEKRRALNMIMT